MDPYTHMLFADYVYKPVFCNKDIFVWGSILPDIGYFGECRIFSDKLHEKRGVLFLKHLFCEVSNPSEKAFLLGWCSHVVLDQVGHTLWTHYLMGKKGVSLKDDIIHRKVEWGLGRIFYKKAEDFSLLKLSKPDAFLFKKIQDEFEKFYKISLGFSLEKDFHSTVKSLEKLIPLAFKFSFFLKPFSFIVKNFPVNKIKRAYPVVFSSKIKRNEQELAFEVFKISKKYFLKAVNTKMEALCEESLDGFEGEGKFPPLLFF